MSIEVHHIHKHFGDFAALNDVSLTFPDGQLTALLGPSGCGKTTLLRIIAGLEHADRGQVLLDGAGDEVPRALGCGGWIGVVFDRTHERILRRLTVLGAQRHLMLLRLECKCVTYKYDLHRAGMAFVAATGCNEVMGFLRWQVYV